MPDETQARTFDAAREAVRRADELLMRQSRLLAVGVGFKVVRGTATDEPCVKAFVARKLPKESLAPGEAVPESLPAAERAVRTDVEEMAMPSAPPWLLDGPGEPAARAIGNRFRHRPVSGGDGVSHFATALGTIGTMVVDAISPERPAILSCNHVLAAVNRGRYGDPVVQPAVSDGGRVQADTCGYLQRWMPVRFGAGSSNLVDAAIARVRAPVVAPWVDWVGVPRGVQSGNAMPLGSAVFKVGRTTGLTTGRVVAVNASVWIPYAAVVGAAATALFREQIVTTAMAAFGDSGALLFDAAHNAVGLLFGGSATHTFFNDIVHVQRELRVTVPVSA